MSENQKSGTLLLGMVFGLLLAGVVGFLTWLIVAAGTVRLDETDEEETVAETEEILDLENLNLDVEEITNDAEIATETLADVEEQIENVYATYWEMDDDPNYIIHQVPLSGLTAGKQIFSKKNVRARAIVGEKIVYAQSPENNTQTTVYADDLATKTSTPLFSLTAKHWVGGFAEGTDGQTFYFADECAATCAVNAESAVTVIKSYNLATKEEKTLYTEKGKWQAFKVVRKLLDANTLLLGEGYEATEGQMFIPQLYTLNLVSATLTTVETDPTATAFSVSPDGKQLAMVTFVYDEQTSRASSLILVKSLADGAVTLIQRGSGVRYHDVRWADADTLAVLSQKVDSIRFELGYSITGEKQLQWVDLDKKVLTAIDLENEPETFAAAVEGKIFYNSQKALVAYDLKTQAGTTVLDGETAYYQILGTR